VRRVVIASLAVVGAVAPARGDGLVQEPGDARSIARAGAVMVSEDGGAALLLNPGAMARRDQLRVRAAMTIRDQDATFDAEDLAAAPAIDDRGPLTGLPQVSVCGPVGPAVGCAAYLETANLDRRLPGPALDLSVAEVGRLFPHRYAGLTARYRRRVVAAGAAMRANDWLGVGVSVSAAMVELGDSRHLWAGDAAQTPVGDASRDLRLEVDGRDWLVPGAAAGVLIAPVSAPIELGLSARYEAAPGLSGEAAVLRTRSSELPIGDPPSGTAAVTLPGELTLRSGVRYLGERVFVEAGGELVLHHGDRAPDWTIDGVAVTGVGGASATLEAVPALAVARDHGGVSAAVDVDAVRGFLWLTAGWSWRTAATPGARVSPALGDLGGHTVAFGAESQWGSTILAIGYARELSESRARAQSQLGIVNPFGTGSGDAGAGRNSRAADVFAASVELAF
jgi:hypothetical protein